MKCVLKWLVIVITGIYIGIFLGVIQYVFGVDGDIISCGYLIALAILAGILIYYLYIQYYLRKLRKFTLPLDSEAAREYIAKIEILLQTAKGRNVRNALKIDLARGYIAAKQFDTAVRILEGLADERFRITVLRLCYLLNLYVSYFGAGQYDKAMELYRANQKIFASYRKDKVYGGNIAIMDIYAAIKNEQYELAERQLHVAQQTWTAPHHQDTFRKMGSFLFEMKMKDKPQESCRKNERGMV